MEGSDEFCGSDFFRFREVLRRTQRIILSIDWPAGPFESVFEICYFVVDFVSLREIETQGDARFVANEMYVHAGSR